MFDNKVAYGSVGHQGALIKLDNGHHGENISMAQGTLCTKEIGCLLIIGASNVFLYVIYFHLCQCKLYFLSAMSCTIVQTSLSFLVSLVLRK